MKRKQLFPRHLHLSLYIHLLRSSSRSKNFFFQSFTLPFLFLSSPPSLLISNPFYLDYDLSEKNKKEEMILPLHPPFSFQFDPSFLPWTLIHLNFRLLFTSLTPFLQPESCIVSSPLIARKSNKELVCIKVTKKMPRGARMLVNSEIFPLLSQHPLNSLSALIPLISFILELALQTDTCTPLFLLVIHYHSSSSSFFIPEQISLSFIWTKRMKGWMKERGDRKMRQHD